MSDKQSILKVIRNGVVGFVRDIRCLGMPLDPQYVEGRRVCIQCHEPIPPNSNNDVCSQYCEMEVWEEFNRQCYLKSGKTPLCKFPRCTKLCYVENRGRVHDFCGKSHAEEHRKMKEAAERQRRNKKRSSGNQWGRGHKLGGGGGGGGGSGGGGGGGHHQGAQNHQGTGHGGGGGSSTWNSSGPIYFYNRDEPYYEFTNFYRGSNIRIDGCGWPTTEHYFQAQKFVGTPYVEMIRRASGPRAAFDLSRDPSISPWRRSDWEDVKIDIMRKALFAKFSQSKHLKDRLLGTGDRLLIERSPYDSFWGDGGDGTGQNKLGNLLMELRAVLRGEDVQRYGTSTPHQPSGTESTVSLETHSSGPPCGGGGGEMRSSPMHPEGLGRRGLHDSPLDSKDKLDEQNKCLIDLTEDVQLPIPLIPSPANSSISAISQSDNKHASLPEKETDMEVENPDAVEKMETCSN